MAKQGQYPQVRLSPAAQDERLRAFFRMAPTAEVLKRHHALADSTASEAESNVADMQANGHDRKAWTEHMEHAATYARAIADYTAWLRGGEPTLNLASVLEL